MNPHPIRLLLFDRASPDALRRCKRDFQQPVAGAFPCSRLGAIAAVLSPSEHAALKATLLDYWLPV